MKEEIAAAVVFITRIVRQSSSVDKTALEKFSNELTKILVERFKNHWYEQAPSKGQAYRCIRVTETEPVDPVLAIVATACGLRLMDLGLPAEFTLWIDPYDVTARFGESMGTAYYTVASLQDDGQLDNQAHLLDVVEMVRSDHLRKSNELSRLQESARRRRYRHTSITTASASYIAALQQQKKYAFFVPGRRVSPTDPYMDSGRVWYNSSPIPHHSLGGAMLMAPSVNDRFHWVHSDELVAV